MNELVFTEVERPSPFRQGRPPKDRTAIFNDLETLIKSHIHEEGPDKIYVPKSEMDDLFERHGIGQGMRSVIVNSFRETRGYNVMGKIGPQGGLLASLPEQGSNRGLMRVKLADIPRFSKRILNQYNNERISAKNQRLIRGEIEAWLAPVRASKYFRDEDFVDTVDLLQDSLSEGKFEAELRTLFSVGV